MGHDPRAARARGWRFRDLRTAQKLLAGFSVMCAAVLGVGLFGLHELEATHDELVEMYTEGLVPIDQLGRVRAALEHGEALILELGMHPGHEAEVRVGMAETDAHLDEELAGARTHLPAALADEADAVEATVAQWRAVRDTQLLPLVSSRQLQQLADVDEQVGEPAFQAAVAAVAALQEAEDAAAQELLAADEAAYDRAHALTLVVIAGTVALGVALALLIARSVSRPLRRAVGVLEDLAQGRLDQRLDVDSRDEIGDMARALDTATAGLADVMRVISGSAATLSAASEELSATSTQLSGSAEETATQAGVVSGAAEEVSASVRTVAAATEEMSASIQEIASNAAEVNTVAGQAVEASGATAQVMGRLGQSSAEIGEVVRVITAIAEQTNLLALNATIEASRAGEAGKGFAVVATEVKELAQETARATEDIVARVASLRADNEEATEAVQMIGRIVGRISERQAAIASAVEQQTATTGEMARSVSEASVGTEEIARNVVGVAQATRETTAGAGNTAVAASECSRMAGELQTLVGRFRW